MSRPIEIKWKNAVELDPPRCKKLFKDFSDVLKIKLVGTDFTITEIQANRSMLSKLCSQNFNDFQWKLETELENQRGWLEDQGLKKFVMFLASGYLITDQGHVWLYILLACAFKSDCFLQAAMNQRLKLNDVDQQTLKSLLTTQLPYLMSVRNNEEVDFTTWMIQNNPDFFRIRTIVNYKANVQATLLQAKGRAGQLDLREIMQLENYINSRVSDPQQQTRTMFKLIPWDYVTVDIVDHYKYRLNEQDCMNKLKIIAEKISEKEKIFQKKRERLSIDLAGVKRLYEEKEKKLHILRLETVIKQENINNPGRYEVGGYTVKQDQSPSYRQDKNKPKYVEKKQPKQPEKNKPYKPSQDQEIQKAIQESLKDKGGKKPEPPAKKPSANQSDRDFELAIQMSKQQNVKGRQPPPPPPPVSRPPPQKDDFIHATDSCKSRQRLQFQCGHTLCLDCMTLRYFNRTEAWTDMEKPLSFDLAAKKKVNCWQCSANLTNKDIQAMNSRRK